MRPIIIVPALIFTILVSACSKNSTTPPASSTSRPGYFTGKYQLYDSMAETYYSNTGKAIDTDYSINTLVTVTVDSSSDSLTYEGIGYKRDSTSNIYKCYCSDYHEVQLTEDSISVTHITNSRIRIFDNSFIHGYRVR
jgi:hypothetical protein